MNVTIDLPDWMVARITNPRDEMDTKLAGAWLLGAVLVAIDPMDEEV